MFNGGEIFEKLSEREDLLIKKKAFLERKIDQALQFVKKNCRKNRKVALQALRRKKWYEKHLKDIDCALKAMRSAHEQIDFVNRVNDLTVHIREEEEDGIQDMSDSLYTSLSFGVEFHEDELLAELERLEKNLDQSQTVSEKDSTEEKDPCPEVLSTAPPSSPGETTQTAKTEEDETEEELEYLRRWVNESS